MTPYYSDSHVEIWHGDCREVLPTLGVFEACITDPPYGLSFMGKDWDRGVPGPHFWEVIREALLPGASCLAFGGTRTFHRLTCAIEDAGFEIRDCLAWLYGSGFPKSLDISKAIDKGARRDYVDAAVRLGMEIPGNSLHDWTKGEHSPSDKWWEAFKEHLSEREWGAIEREVVGTAYRVRRESVVQVAGLSEGEYVVTAPATEAAKLWPGWGTALKPAHEIIVGAQKPHNWRGVVSVTAHTIMEALCRLPSAAKDAGLISQLSRNVSGEECDSALWSAVERCSTPGALSDLMATWPSGSVTPTSLSIACSWLNTLGDLLKHGSTFTTETATGLTTDLGTLNSSRSAITPATIIGDAIHLHGTGSSASLAASTFNAVDARLRLTLARSAHESATAGEPASPLDAIGELTPAWEPCILAMNPTEGTFAENALEHGVAGLNIDGARIGTEDTRGKASKTALGVMNDDGWEPREVLAGSASGRWPANVALDEEAARLLDEQSGERPSGYAHVLRRGHTTGRGMGYQSSAAGNVLDATYGDSGGASRFYYTSKASRADRGEGNTHPTVKPTDLMEWLCKLVATPTGGTVLDPFMGSGTTLVAARNLGRKAVGIELEEEHCEIAARRLSQGVLAL